MLRTHTNGELNAAHIGKTVSLTGWVAVSRDHGGLVFVDLRDRWGITQLVFNPDNDSKVHQTGSTLRSEDCIGIKGVVCARPEGTKNSKLSTGDIEVNVESVEVFSRSETPPFELDTTEYISEEVRLKHRYLDLRRASMQESLLFRNKLIHSTRCFMNDNQFVEIDTPILTKSTPEGARDYLVPSRVHPGSFFALPQSPQLFKQILMVSGFDRYFQIAKCFRDEDLRADRQPEFTQIDLEMSFVEQEDIFRTIEALLQRISRETMNIDLKAPFERLTYADAMKRYGSDKPDLRFGLEIEDVSSVFTKTSFKIFQQTLAGNGSILALKVPGSTDKFSRKDYDALIEFSKEHGASGLAYVKIVESGIESPIAKFLTEEEVTALKDALPGKGQAGDVVFFAADKTAIATKVLGALRGRLGKQLNLIEEGTFKWTWITDFPLFHYNEEEKRWESEHHPFTSPNKEDIAKLGTDNGAVRSSSYDLVLNGNEIASGSIRIHDKATQQKIFDIIGLEPEETLKRFGFLLRSFEYGPPPHAGIALGLDRLLTIFLGRESIRDVIAFPKTQRAICPMTSAPSDVPASQLKELSIRVA